MRAREPRCGQVPAMENMKPGNHAAVDVGVELVCQVDRVASESIENASEEMDVEVDVEEHKGSDEKA